MGFIYSIFFICINLDTITWCDEQMWLSTYCCLCIAFIVLFVYVFDKNPITRHNIRLIISVVLFIQSSMSLMYFGPKIFLNFLSIYRYMGCKRIL